jgi:hypothetical protein
MKCSNRLPSVANLARENHRAQTLGKAEEEEIIVYRPFCD